MRRGTLIAIVVIVVILAAAAVFQIAAFTSDRRPEAPVPSASPT